MKKLFYLLITLYSAFSFAECTKHHHDPIQNLDNYYASTEGLNSSDLKSALNSIISGHKRYSYTPCVWTILKEADEDPNNPQNVIGIYTGRSIPKSRQDSGSNDPNSWNREHIWSKSHGFKEKYQHAYTDAHHLRAADRSVNSDRSDHDFAEGGVPDDECSGCKEGQGTWEPPHNVKGDIARMMFYMDVRYDGGDSSKTPDLQLVDKVDTPRSQTVAQFGKLCTLLKWHMNDPVSTAEIKRNDIIHSWQGNRNPFVDRPKFAKAIWGHECSIDNKDKDKDKDKDQSYRTSSVDEIKQRLNSVILELNKIQQQLDQLEK